MTSTSFNVGLTEKSRPSSRVLHPPGGSHTDIFGRDPEPQQIGRRGLPTAIVCPEESKPATGTEPSQNGQKSPQKAALVPLAAAAAAPAIVAPEQGGAEPPKRVRVPPGGFSSKLW